MDKKRKYLMVLTDLNMGGVTTAAVNFCNGLFERGNDVDVLVMTDGQEKEEERFTKGIGIKHLEGFDKLWNLGAGTIKKEKNPIKKFALYLIGLVKKMANKKSLWVSLLFGKRRRFSGYDAVLAYRQCSPCYYFALNCVEAKKKAAFIHGDRNFMGDISTWEKYLCDFDAVLYVSEAVKNGFIEYNGNLASNAATVYNVFDTEEIFEKAKEPFEMKFSEDVVNLVTVSRIESVLKGTDRIPEVCSRLKENFLGKFHWYVVGGGPDLENLKERAEELSVSDHLTFLGQKSNPYNVLSKADICVFTTKSEAFGMIVGESLVLGIPIVSTRYPAIEEIVVDGKNGLIAEQSVESIAEKTGMLIGNKDLYKKLKEECVSFRYDNDRSYKQLTEALFK